jgi:hypothetical protein
MESLSNAKRSAETAKVIHSILSDAGVQKALTKFPLDFSTQ